MGANLGNALARFGQATSSFGENLYRTDMMRMDKVESYIDQYMSSSLAGISASDDFNLYNTRYNEIVSGITPQMLSKEAGVSESFASSYLKTGRYARQMSKYDTSKKAVETRYSDKEADMEQQRIGQWVNGMLSDDINALSNSRNKTEYDERYAKLVSKYSNLTDLAEGAGYSKEDVEKYLKLNGRNINNTLTSKRNGFLTNQEVTTENNNFNKNVSRGAEYARMHISSELEKITTQHSANYDSFKQATDGLIESLTPEFLMENAGLSEEEAKKVVEENSVIWQKTIEGYGSTFKSGLERDKYVVEKKLELPNILSSEGGTLSQNVNAFLDSIKNDSMGGTVDGILLLTDMNSESGNPLTNVLNTQVNDIFEDDIDISYDDFSDKAIKSFDDFIAQLKSSQMYEDAIGKNFIDGLENQRDEFIMTLDSKYSIQQTHREEVNSERFKEASRLASDRFANGQDISVEEIEAIIKPWEDPELAIPTMTSLCIDIGNYYSNKSLNAMFTDANVDIVDVIDKVVSDESIADVGASFVYDSTDIGGGRSQSDFDAFGYKKKPKLDEQGNQVFDKDGNPVMEETPNAKQESEDKLKKDSFALASTHKISTQDGSVVYTAYGNEVYAVIDSLEKEYGITLDKGDVKTLQTIASMVNDYMTLDNPNVISAIDGFLASSIDLETGEPLTKTEKKKKLLETWGDKLKPTTLNDYMNKIDKDESETVAWADKKANIEKEVKTAMAEKGIKTTDPLYLQIIGGKDFGIWIDDLASQTYNTGTDTYNTVASYISNLIYQEDVKNIGAGIQAMSSLFTGNVSTMTAEKNKTNGVNFLSRTATAYYGDKMPLLNANPDWIINAFNSYKQNIKTYGKNTDKWVKDTIKVLYPTLSEETIEDLDENSPYYKIATSVCGLAEYQAIQEKEIVSKFLTDKDGVTDGYKAFTHPDYGFCIFSYDKGIAITQRPDQFGTGEYLFIKPDAEYKEDFLTDIKNYEPKMDRDGTYTSGSDNYKVSSENAGRFVSKEFNCGNIENTVRTDKLYHHIQGNSQFPEVGDVMLESRLTEESSTWKKLFYGLAYGPTVPYDPQSNAPVVELTWTDITQEPIYINFLNEFMAL